MESGRMNGSIGRKSNASRVRFQVAGAVPSGFPILALLSASVASESKGANSCSVFRSDVYRWKAHFDGLSSHFAPLNKVTCHMLSSHNAGRAMPDMAKTVNSEIKFLRALLTTNIVVTLFHYADNIPRLHEYPDHPTTTVGDIVLYFLIMMPFGLAGYWLYVNKRHIPSYYMFYIYCLLNAAVIGQRFHPLTQTPPSKKALMLVYRRPAASAEIAPG
jgi:hypothetical protein